MWPPLNLIGCWQMRIQLAWLLVLLAWSLVGAERKFDLADLSEGQTPPGFLSAVSGKGKPGDWKIVLDEVPSLLPPLSPQAVSHARRPVLGQLAQDATDDHYPLLVFEDEVFGDFTLTTRFKLVSGVAEQMAGLAFRIQDEKNYYYVRASGLGNTFYFFKFVKGELVGPIGSKVEISKGVWHEMSVECKGSQVTCSLDGKVIIPQLMQNTFAKGKIGFWTKSDSVSYFSDTRVVYTPIVPPAQTIAREVLKKYSRLLGLKLYVPGADPLTSRVVAAKEPGDVGQAGGSSELDVLSHGAVYYGKDKETVSVIMPVHDRNGEIVAALRVLMKSFPGQTEQNALERARPIVKDLEGRMTPLKSLLE